jgi:hypothetical protein
MNTKNSIARNCVTVRSRISAQWPSRFVKRWRTRMGGTAATVRPLKGSVEDMVWRLPAHCDRSVRSFESPPYLSVESSVMTGAPKTKGGDVIIRCFSDEPTTHAVSPIRNDFEVVGDSPEIARGRIEAISRANRLRGEAGRIYLQEDDHWLDITEGEDRVDAMTQCGSRPSSFSVCRDSGRQGAIRGKARAR